MKIDEFKGTFCLVGKMFSVALVTNVIFQLLSRYKYEKI
jgi:hypothetical protein